LDRAGRRRLPLSVHCWYAKLSFNDDNNDIINMPSYGIATRAQALTLKLTGYASRDIERIAVIKPRPVNNMLEKVIARGLNPKESIRILDYHVEDGQRSGRPKTNSGISSGTNLEHDIRSSTMKGGVRELAHFAHFPLPESSFRETIPLRTYMSLSPIFVFSGSLMYWLAGPRPMAD
jgi:hypothetical protein